MKKFLLLSFLFIGITSFSQITISGIVKDVLTNKPLSKTKITLIGATKTIVTNETGAFSIELPKGGAYDIEITKNGYNSLYQQIELYGSVDIEITLMANNNTLEEKTSAKETIEEKRLAEKFRYERELAKKKLAVEKKNEEIQKARSSRMMNPMAKFMNKEIMTFSGTIKDKDSGNPISKAIISFNGIDKTYTTTEDGVFKFSLKKGKYFMIVEKKGYKTESSTIPVENDLDITVLLTEKSVETITTSEVIVTALRASDKTPTSFATVKKVEILENSLGKDLPYLLEHTPSIVASSDGGNGVGYTSMRIRGSDMTRINFTINGFPVNDAESQGVFLVNMPDLSSDIEDVQIQRGIGTSTNGAGAFGASVNINTNKKEEKRYLDLYNSYGSFNTMKNTIKAGSGLLFKHLILDGRFSHLMSDGYIDRASVKMFGYSANATYYSAKSNIKFSLFSGKEITHQAWNGIDKNTMETDRTFNSAGTDYGQLATPHDNEIDNYKQDNYQLSFSHKFDYRLSAKLGFHYTKGMGYFEQYKVDEDLKEYAVTDSSINSDLIRRRWLNNDFYGTIFSLIYKIKNLNTTLGAAWNYYDGDHFGKVFDISTSVPFNKDKYYYLNTGLKSEYNSFLKAEYTIRKKIVLFGDLQYRRVAYTVEGTDNDQKNLSVNKKYDFINPKLGISYILKNKNLIYASFAMANREPTRNDFIDNIEDPKHETMMDYEIGYRAKRKKLKYNINSFFMNYKNQLVLTGELNDVGSSVRKNVEKSFRTGVELELAYEHSKYFGLNTSATWSMNKIDEFTDGNSIFNKTDIAYSPSYLANLTLYTKAFKGFKFALINKYVGEQFLDNTSNKNKSLTAYLLTDARISYSLNPKFMKKIEFILKANNLLNSKYASNGYVYYDTPYFYPQAGINFEGGINLKF